MEKNFYAKLPKSIKFNNKTGKSFILTKQPLTDTPKKVYYRRALAQKNNPYA